MWYKADERTAAVPYVDPNSPGVERWRLVDNLTLESPDWDPPNVPLEEAFFAAWRDPDECMAYFSEMWRAKWYQKVWYGLGCLLRTGHWPLRIWVIPRNEGKLDHELYQKIYQEVSRHPRAYVSS